LEALEPLSNDFSSIENLPSEDVNVLSLLIVDLGEDWKIHENNEFIHYLKNMENENEESSKKNHKTSGLQTSLLHAVPFDIPGEQFEDSFEKLIGIKATDYFTKSSKDYDPNWKQYIPKPEEQHTIYGELIPMFLNDYKDALNRLPDQQKSAIKPETIQKTIDNYPEELKVNRPSALEQIKKELKNSKQDNKIALHMKMVQKNL
jgi:hypothetical protein